MAARTARAEDVARTRAEGAGAIGAERFGELLREHRRTLWGVAAGVLNSPADADDVVQEATLVAYQKIAEYREGTSFAAWMSQIVRYTALNHSRRLRRERQRSPWRALAARGRRGQAPPDAPSEAAGLEPTDPALLRAMADLGDVARICLLLRSVEGLSYEQIGAALDIPPNTAMSHVFRARRRLQGALAGESGGEA